MLKRTNFEENSMILENARISRKGATENYWGDDKTASKIWFKAGADGLEINFEIDSKGGGRTCINVKIGEGDVPKILTEILEQHEKSSSWFINCAELAFAKEKQRINSKRSHLIKLINNATSDFSEEYQSIELESDRAKQMVVGYMNGIVKILHKENA